MITLILKHSTVGQKIRAIGIGFTYPPVSHNALHSFRRIAMSEG